MASAKKKIAQARVELAEARVRLAEAEEAEAGDDGAHAGAHAGAHTGAHAAPRPARATDDNYRKVPCRHGALCTRITKPGGCNFLHTREEVAASRAAHAAAHAAPRLARATDDNYRKVPCRHGAKCTRLTKPGGCDFLHTREELAAARAGADDRSDGAASVDGAHS